jgi:hypothetical protein
MLWCMWHWPLQGIVIQCHNLVLLDLVYVSLFASGSVFLSVRPPFLYPLNSAQTSSSSLRDFSFGHDSRESGRWKSKEELDRTSGD